MKKIFLVCLNIILLLIVLSACGPSKAAINVINQINEIGKVTLDCGDKIELAENSFSALKDRESAQVTNYSVLRDSRAKYDELREEYDAYQLFVKSAEDIISSSYKDMSNYFTLSSDKKSVKVDTKVNKNDYFGTIDAIKLMLEFHKTLGLPDSLVEKMYVTRALDGTQSQTAGKITVTWNYHPDDGLHVVYEYDYEG